MSEDITGYQTSVATLSPGSPSVTISGTINAYGTVGQYSAEINGALSVFTAEAALFAPAAGRFTITNAGLIETQGSVSGNLADAGVLLGAAGTLRNTGTILGGSGLVVFETLGSSTIENANFIEGSFGVGVIVFGNTATSATVVNSGTILGAPDHDGGAVDVFGNGFVSNAAGGVLIADASYAIGGQAGLVTVVNSGAITGFFGGINLQGGGFASNAGYIHALGLGDTLSQSSYVGINADLGGTAVNSGTILGQNGINVHYGNGTITGAIQGYAANTGLIEAFSTYGLQGIDINGSDNFGVGIELQMPGTVVNAGSITATSAGIYTENGFAVVRNAQSGVIISQIGIDLSANGANGTLNADLGYVENSGTVAAYSTVNVTGDFQSGFDQTGVGIYAAAAGTVVNHGTIAGNHVGVVFWNGIGTVINSGLITEASGAEVAGATPGYGVYLHKGGTVTNTGTIIGQNQAIFAGYTFNVVNTGMIDATAEPFLLAEQGTTFTAISTAIFSDGTGEVTNGAGGTVEASTGVGILVYGLEFDAAEPSEIPVAATLVNQGVVRAQYGVEFYGLGSVNNSGTILGTVFAAEFFVPPPQAHPTLVNSGLLAAGFGEVAELGATVAGVGVTLSGGTVLNLAGGTITADTAIFSRDFTRYSNPFSLDNAGLIAGYGFGVYASNASALVVNSGSITAASTKGGPGSYQTSGGVYGAGVYLAAGGTVINNGAVSGTNVGIAIEAIAGSVANSGIVSGDYAIYLQGGGQATNTGTVIATNQGIGSGGSETDSGGPTGITNSGVIEMSGTPYVVADGGFTYTAVATGILDFGGTADNAAGGVILAPHGAGMSQYGELRNPLNGTFYAAPAALINAGTVIAAYGIAFAGLGSANNSGTIIGTATGAKLVQTVEAAPLLPIANAPPPVLVNSGLIDASLGEVVNAVGETVSGIGVTLAGGDIYNLAQGTIEGDIAIYATGTSSSPSYPGVLDLPTPLYLDNAGTILGSRDGIFAKNNPATIVNSGTIAGNIQLAGGSANRLIIAPSAAFNGTVDGGGSGALALEAGNGALNGFGTEFIGFNTIAFDPGAAWTLAGNSPGLAAGQTLTGFAAGDALDVQDVTLASQSLVIGAGGTLALGPVSLDFAGAGGDAVTITSDGATGVDIRLETAPCFCAGTRIATTRGDMLVEDLAAGDQVITQSGAARAIQWIGTRAYDGRFIAGNHLILPVCLRAGALGEAKPRRDLWVSPGHAVWVAGTLVPAWRLVNGVTVVQAERVEAVQYFHIELATHDVILAEGCPAESYYDNGGRAQFQRSSGTAATPAAPALARLEDGFALEALRRRLRGGAPAGKPGALRGFIDQIGPIVSGWAQDPANPEVPVCLDVLAQGRRIARVLANQYRADLRAAGLGSGCHGFMLRLPEGFSGKVSIQASATGARLLETEAALARVA